MYNNKILKANLYDVVELRCCLALTSETNSEILPISSSLRAISQTFLRENRCVFGY